LDFKFTEKLHRYVKLRGKSITIGAKSTSSLRAEENALFGKWAITRASRKVYWLWVVLGKRKKNRQGDGGGNSDGW